jgi:fructoselysine-6-P-deglycase FrlB-like protein
MNPEAFLADLEAKPAALRALAGRLREEDPWAQVPAAQRILFLGMGSSRYAADVAAARLRAEGTDAVAEYASSEASYPPAESTLVVAISATGASRETLDAVSRYTGRSPVVALTNTGGSPLAKAADTVISMHAGPEEGGVACRTYQHTLLLLLARTSPDPAGLAERTAQATADLLDRRHEWLPPAIAVLDGPDGVYTLAPAEHLSSARQSALMFREGPRRAAAACETGDWAHVDVYLTKTLDYRALLFPGSRYDKQAMDWIRERRSRVLAVGPGAPDAEYTVRYQHDDDPDVALLTETLVAELIAQHWWAFG